MNSHTPGPWSANVAHYPIHVKDSDGLDTVCRIGGHDTSDPETCEANARLIAAAPALYVALTALMGTCAIEWERKWPNVIAACRQAVAQAEGREP